MYEKKNTLILSKYDSSVNKWVTEFIYQDNNINFVNFGRVISISNVIVDDINFLILTAAGENNLITIAYNISNGDYSSVPSKLTMFSDIKSIGTSGMRFFNNVKITSRPTHFINNWNTILNIFGSYVNDGTIQEKVRKSNLP